MQLNQENTKMYSRFKKNIGLIGTGYWGKNLVRVFSELGVLKIICDLDKKILAERKKEYPGLKTTTNFQEILKDRNIKGVVISTPAVTHYNLVKEALLARKDVLVEKPLVLRTKQGEGLIKLAKNKKLILMVGHQYLYHPAVVKLESLINKGKLGEIQYIYSKRAKFGIFRGEENVFWSFAPHDISVIIDILGVPERVWAIGKSYLQKNISDIVLSYLEFKNNQGVHIFVSWLNPFKEQRLVVIGSKAMAVFDDRAKAKLVIYPYQIEKKRRKERPRAKKISEGNPIKIPEKEPLMEEAKHFLECIKKRKVSKTGGEEALKVLKVLDACQKSINQNGKRILIT